MSKSAEGLQNCLNKLHSYSKLWGLTVNVNKTKTMVFNKGNRFINNVQFYFDNNLIETVKQFTYVGVLITPNGKFKQNQNNLKNKAMKALFSIKKSILCERMLNPRLCLKLFDTLIAPILSYASEIWATEIKRTDNCLESICMSFYRFILGVSKCTPLEGVRAELGRLPLKISLYMSVIRYWCRLNSLPANDILKKALTENRKIQSPWVKFINQYMGSCDHMHVFSSLGVKSYCQLKKKMKENFTRDYMDSWKRNLLDDTRKNGSGNKLRTYRIFKTQFVFEKYLEYLSDFTLCKHLCKFRLSDHNLGIEMGRKSKPRLPLNERICQRCDYNEIDDEFHLLFSCKNHTSERIILGQSSGTDFSQFYSHLEKEKIVKKLMEQNILDLAVFLKSTNVC